jgi:WXXGXW repeat (2 copies)
MKGITRNLLGAAALGALLFTAGTPSMAADVVVKVAPPALRVETPPASPGVDFAWRPGYWRWGGTEHVWVGGAYERRPHPGAEWQPGNWDHRGDGWVWGEGHWN